jgi:hypothetical protein
LLFPSSHVVHRFLGWPGFGIYVLLAALFFVVWHRFHGHLTLCFNRPLALILLLFTFLILLAGFIYFFPRADAGIIGGGSDRDDALNVAVRELLSGRYPYYARTYLDNPISPLPGSIMLSAPFVLVGDSAYQNFFWLSALAGVAWWTMGRVRDALLFLWFILASAPIVLREIFTGSDLLANGIFVFIFVLLLCLPNMDFRRRLAVAVLLGLGLASRAHFLLVVPLVFAFLARREGVRQAFFLILTTTLTFVVVTLPFVLYDPAGFAPMHTAGRLAVFGIRVPFTWLIPLVTAILVLLLSFRQRKTFDGLALSCATVLAMPFVMGLGAPLLVGEMPRLRLIGYGVSALPFGAWFVWNAVMDVTH